MVNGRRLALISVTVKEGVERFAKDLHELGFDLLSAGNTLKKIAAADLPVIDLADWIGRGEWLGHKVLTLSGELHGSIMANDMEIEEIERAGLRRVHLVCCDFYDAKKAINAPDATPQSVRQATDIGGPTMVSSAAKAARIVIAVPEDRQEIVNWLRAGEPDKDEFINALCAKADFLVSQYRMLTAAYHSGGRYQGIFSELVRQLAYGENRYQALAAHRSYGTADPLALERFKQVAGSEPSFNNMTDLDRLVQTVTHIAAGFDQNFDYRPLLTPQIAVVVKHGNPCAAGVGLYPADAIVKMGSGDPLAAFGGAVMTNFPITADLADLLLSAGQEPGKTQKFDGIVAPWFEEGAADAMERKGGKCRMFANKALADIGPESIDTSPIRRPVRGGELTQPNYTYILNLGTLGEGYHSVGDMTNAQEMDMILAWAIAATSNSNTITLVKNGQLIGNAVGQQDRVGAAELAVRRAHRSGHNTKYAVAASDSFFPFKDGPQVLVEAGIAAIFATSGSRADEEVIGFLKDEGVALRMVPDAVGRGFFRH